jgi:phosphoglycolate phosphatase-like HAD superfamily hydrolase
MMPTLDPDRIRAICFDIDGTLVDTDDEYVRRLARWLLPLRPILPEGKEGSVARLAVMAAETPTNALLHVLDALHLDGLVGGIFNLLHYLRGEAKRGQYTAIPDVPEMLSKLNARYPLAIVTAREQRSTETLLDVMGWRRFFTVVATARTCRRGKPHPEPVRWAAGQLNLHPEALLMVGDTTVDIRAGRSAGAQTAGVLCGFGTRDELERSGCDLILQRTPDILAWLGMES